MTTTLTNLGRVSFDEEYVEIRRLDTRMREREDHLRRRRILADIRERYGAKGYEDVEDGVVVGCQTGPAPDGPYRTPARTGVRPVR